MLAGKSGRLEQHHVDTQAWDLIHIRRPLARNSRKWKPVAVLSVPLRAGRRIRWFTSFNSHLPQKAATFAHIVRAASCQDRGHSHRSIRKGKYLLLGPGSRPPDHAFRLDGQLVWFSNGMELLKRGQTPPPPPPGAKTGVHVGCRLENGHWRPRFRRRRHFGSGPFLGNPSKNCSGSTFWASTPSRMIHLGPTCPMLCRSKRPLKGFLLGPIARRRIGNIYSCEVFCGATASTPRPAAPSTLRKQTGKGAAGLATKQLCRCLHGGLRCCLHPAPTFGNPEWWFPGPGKRDLRVVNGREGKKHLSSLAASLPGGRSQGGRSTYFGWALSEIETWV